MGRERDRGEVRKQGEREREIHTYNMGKGEEIVNWEERESPWQRQKREKVGAIRGENL